MPSANQSITPTRRVREGIKLLWPGGDFSQISSDEALRRLAEARNSASKTANTFMLWAALLAFLYFLRVQGIADNLSVGSYKLADLPFGQFVFCSTALIVSCVSLVRAGDSRSFDRYLRFACEESSDDLGVVRYHSFPNEHAWGEPFSRIVYFPHVGFIAWLMRGLSLFFMNLFVLSLVLAPAVVGFDYLINSRSEAEPALEVAKNTFVIFLLITNILTFYLFGWIRAADKD